MITHHYQEDNNLDIHSASCYQPLSSQLDRQDLSLRSFIDHQKLPCYLDYWNLLSQADFQNQLILRLFVMSLQTQTLEQSHLDFLPEIQLLYLMMLARLSIYLLLN